MIPGFTSVSTSASVARWPSFLILFVFLSNPLFLSAQEKDSVRIIPPPIHKNVIKINLTPMILWSNKDLTISYERILNAKQSVTFSVGYLEFPSLFKDTIADIAALTSREKYGINLAFEYRFYLTQRNTRPIPDGLYLAPFLSYAWYQCKNDFEILHLTTYNNGKLKGDFNIFNTGVELGYQLVFWKRLTVDLVLLGPTISYYYGSVAISGPLDQEKVKEFHEVIYKKLTEKYPMIEDYVINKSFRDDGELHKLSIGVRTLFQIGFHF